MNRWNSYWPPPWKPGDLVWPRYAYKAYTGIVVKVWDRPGVETPSTEGIASRGVPPNTSLFWLVEVVGNGTSAIYDSRELEWLQKPK